MSRYSISSLFRHAFSRHENWPPAWRDPEPKTNYDVVIIGGGGHGLATAYHLAKEHGITNVAVLEKGWIGGGNTGRNGGIIRSNYLNASNCRFNDYSVKLWETLSQELNFNVMFSQRGSLFLAHTDGQMEGMARVGNSMLENGVDAEVIERDEVRRLAPYLDFSAQARFPIHGALLQRRAGVARHDAVVWGYARGADTRGVDIIQDCEVNGIKVKDGHAVGVETNRGYIAAGKVALAVAGHTSRVASMAGLRLPMETHLLQAMVSEPYKPFINHVISYGAGHFYVSQTDKGGMVIGGDLDGYNSYSQRGNVAVVENLSSVARSLIPSIGRLHILRHWAGVMDMSMDGSPIICESPVRDLFISSGWCYGGFKTIPAGGWCYADTIANSRPHELVEAFSLERFNRGALLEEKAHGPIPNLH